MYPLEEERGQAEEPDDLGESLQLHGRRQPGPGADVAGWVVRAKGEMRSIGRGDGARVYMQATVRLA